MERSKVKEQFENEGYAIIENFLTEEDIKSLREAMADIINSLDPKEHQTVFISGNKQVSDDYLMNSADKIRFFFEEGAIQNGDLVVDKTKAVNKVGHALHCLSPAFRRISFSDKVKNVARAIGFEDPVICQSMYIFKQPHIGGKVVPHQDSTYLYTKPMSLAGMWFALEDATLENGCLWFIPGSHKEGLYGDYRWVRKEQVEPGTSATKYIGTEPVFDDSKFIPVQVKKGTLVLFCGETVHKSEHNYSDKSREIYTFHMYEGTSTYDTANWLQPTEAGTFSHLYSQS